MSNYAKTSANFVHYVRKIVDACKGQNKTEYETEN